MQLLAGSLVPKEPGQKSQLAGGDRKVCMQGERERNPKKEETVKKEGEPKCLDFIVKWEEELLSLVGEVQGRGRGLPATPSNR